MMFVCFSRTANSNMEYVAGFMMAIMTLTTTTTMTILTMILNTTDDDIDDDGDNSDDSDTCQTDGSIEYGQNMHGLGSQQICSQCAINHNVIKTIGQSLETSNAIISM